MEPVCNSAVGPYHNAAAAARSCQSPVDKITSRIRNVLRFNSEPTRLPEYPQTFAVRGHSAPQLNGEDVEEIPSLSILCQKIEQSLIAEVGQAASENVSDCVSAVLMKQGFALLSELVQKVETNSHFIKEKFQDKSTRADFLGCIKHELLAQNSAHDKVENLHQIAANISAESMPQDLKIVVDFLKILYDLRTNYALFLPVMRLRKARILPVNLCTDIPFVKDICEKRAHFTLASDCFLISPDQVTRSMNPSGVLIPDEIMIGQTDFLAQYAPNQHGNVEISCDHMIEFYVRLLDAVAKNIPMDKKNQWYPGAKIMRVALKGYFESEALDLDDYLKRFPLLRLLPLFSVNSISQATLLQSQIFHPLRERSEFLLRSGGKKSIQIEWNNDTQNLECIRKWQERIYLGPQYGQDEKMIATTSSGCKIQLCLPGEREVTGEFWIDGCAFARGVPPEDITLFCKVFPKCMAAAQNAFL